MRRVHWQEVHFSFREVSWHLTLVPDFAIRAYRSNPQWNDNLAPHQAKIDAVVCCRHMRLSAVASRVESVFNEKCGGS